MDAMMLYGNYMCMETMVLYGIVVWMLRCYMELVKFCMDCYVSKDSWVLNLVL